MLKMQMFCFLTATCAGGLDEGTPGTVCYNQHSLFGCKNKQQEDKVQLFAYLLHAGGRSPMTYSPAQGQCGHRSSRCAH